MTVIPATLAILILLVPGVNVTSEAAITASTLTAPAVVELNMYMPLPVALEQETTIRPRTLLSIEISAFVPFPMSFVMVFVIPDVLLFKALISSYIFFSAQSIVIAELDAFHP